MTDPAETIALWPDGPPTTIAGVPPEVRYVEQRGVAQGKAMLRNITDATLSVFAPDDAVRNGVGVIVAPGGGWTISAWEHEGLDVAAWLTPLGYTVFVLKYRVQASEADQAAFEQRWASMDSSVLTIPAPQKPTSIGALVKSPEYTAARTAAADDGRRAIAVVRENAARYGLRPDAIGMIGFSAGSFLIVDVALDPRADQVAFIAPIYGGETNGAPVPGDAPPLFTAVAQDDFLVRIVEGLYTDWAMADRPAEMHVFRRGQHGFGMVKQGAPSDAWTDLLLTWMQELTS